MMRRKRASIYRAKAVMQQGCQVEITARDHTIIADEPAPMGKDSGMMPIELLLAALSSCKTIVLQETAKNLQIPLSHLSVEVEGDFDAAGFMGDPTVPIGFSALRTLYHIESPATSEDIDTLIAYVESHCPVAATLTNTPESTIEIDYRCTTAKS